LTTANVALIHEDSSVKALLAFLRDADVWRQQFVDEPRFRTAAKNPT
jgi:hypothetical protein